MVLSGSSSRDSKQMAHSVDVSMKVDFADMVDRASVATRAGVFVERLWLLWEGGVALAVPSLDLLES